MLSFFESVDRAHFLCGAVATDPDAVAALAQAAMRAGICPETRRSIEAETRAQIAALLASLAAARG